MFSEELKRETSGVHTELEKKLIPHIRKVKDSGSYIALLYMMYGFYYPLQQLVQPYQDQLKHVHYYRGRQAEHIVADIQALGANPKTGIPVNPYLPQIQSYPDAIGALYVAEGSTLGGKIIAKMLSKQVPDDISGALSFFNAYGEETDAAWVGFKEIINQPREAEQQQRILNSAKETFTSFKNWLVAYESGTNQQVRF